MLALKKILEMTLFFNEANLEHSISQGKNKGKGAGSLAMLLEWGRHSQYLYLYNKSSGFCPRLSLLLILRIHCFNYTSCAHNFTSSVKTFPLISTLAYICIHCPT